MLPLVAASLRALGSDVAALSVVGDDHNGRVLLEMLSEKASTLDGYCRTLHDRPSSKSA